MPSNTLTNKFVPFLGSFSVYTPDNCCTKRALMTSVHKVSTGGRRDGSFGKIRSTSCVLQLRIERQFNENNWLSTFFKENASKRQLKYSFELMDMQHKKQLIDARCLIHQKTLKNLNLMCPVWILQPTKTSLKSCVGSNDAIAKEQLPLMTSSGVEILLRGSAHQDECWFSGLANHCFAYFAEMFLLKLLKLNPSPDVKMKRIASRIPSDCRETGLESGKHR
jgi:hypothetical protein